MLGLIGTVAGAQSRIPAHRIDKDKTSQACVVSLIPVETYGTAPPVLTVTTQGKSRPGSFAISAKSAPGTIRLDLVFQNQRSDFEAVGAAPVKSIATTPLWKMIADSDAKKGPFFLTARTGDGRYASARYEAIDPEGILSILETQCGIKSNTISVQSPEQLLARERALDLSGDQLRHIRWILNSRYGDATKEPVIASQLTKDERTYLERYSVQVGQPKSAYLNRTLANRLLRDSFVAETPNRSSLQRYSSHGDWEIYKWGRDQCAASSPALRWTGLNLYVRPEMRFSATYNIAGSNMNFDMVSPNPFRGDAPVRAIVDGRSYPLQQRGGGILPPREGDGLSTVALKAIRRGRTVEIRGTSVRSGRTASVFFSASGFTSAFTQLIRECRRPGLRDWF